MDSPHRFIRALRRQPVDTTPVWIMRQAGRYLPEYRATRAEAGDFLTLCKTPELACEVTMQPLRRFELDAAILFSDILTIPDAMGLGLSLVEKQGPRFDRPVCDLSAIQALGVPDPEDDLGYVMDAVRLIRKTLDGRTPLIGFAGSPWTLACYMVEGQGSRDFARIKTLAYDRPDAMAHLLDTLVESITLYLNAQIAAGAQAVQIFDTWGGSLSYDAYRRWSLEPMQRIVAGLDRGPEDAPVILFTKGGAPWLEQIADAGADALGLDWCCDPADARRRVGHRVALQGNLDPGILRADNHVIEREVARTLDAFGPQPGHVFNLGHGITPDIRPDAVATLVNAVHGHPFESA